MALPEDHDIPVVILAGGRGARFDHESQVKPKPMIEVAGKPILQHIIDSFVSQGFREFIIATGYLEEEIRKYFGNWAEVCAAPTAKEYANDPSSHWWFYLNGDVRVKVVSTGTHSHTGERVRRLAPHIDKRRFILTYGDGLSDVQMEDVIAQHLSPPEWDLAGTDDHPAAQRPLVTLTAVHPPGRFGILQFNGAYYRHVRKFSEKANEWINGGFMVCEPEFISEYLEGGLALEDEALPLLADHWRLQAYQHRGYWRCMDTRRDLEQIEADVGSTGHLPWLSLKED
jgi:glucose-1-phosphate cytidylyltransferase